MEKLWIVIVTYNSEPWIKQCLLSVYASVPNPNIVIVDNASTDHTREIIAKFADLEIMLNDCNLGFALAANQGTAYALKTGAEFIVHLNPDAVLGADTLSKLMAAACRYPEYGILVPMNLSDEGSRIDPLYLREMRRYLTRKAFKEISRAPMHEVYEVQRLPGALMFSRRGFLIEKGGYDPLFTRYGVEYDYCLRAVGSSWKVGLVPAATVRHSYDRQGKDEGWHSAIFRAIALISIKRSDYPIILMYLYVLSYGFYNIFKAALSGRTSKVPSLIRVFFEVATLQEQLMYHRKICQNQKKVFLSF